MSRLALPLLFTLLALATFRSIHAQSADNSHADASTHYIVLIDAGSTGSRAHIHTYTYADDKVLPVVQPSVNKKIKPGLSSYAKHPQDASKPIGELLQFIKSSIPMQHWPDTPIHLQATAGLRSIAPHEAEAILNVVRDVFAASGFKFERSWAKIISGAQEGINGWIATNYLLGTFDTPGSGTMGVVEMGGSSTQLTFAPHNPTDQDKQHLIPLTLANAQYYLYTYSYLEYGLQAAERLYQRLAIGDIEEKGNPCYPKQLRHSSVGAFKDCVAMIGKYLFDKTKCTFHSCSFNNVYQPSIQHEPFLAIENFFYTSEFFKIWTSDHDAKCSNQGDTCMIPKGNQLTRHLASKGEEYCNLDWPVINSKHKHIEPTELSVYCFATAYESLLLEHGFGFSHTHNLRPARLIHGKPIDWELGAVIWELNGGSDTNSANVAHSEYNVQDGAYAASRSFFVRANGSTCTSCVFIIGALLSVALVGLYTLMKWNRKKCENAASVMGIQLSAYSGNNYKV